MFFKRKFKNVKIDGLTEGTTYEFRLTAKNSAGPSDPALLPKPVTAKLPYGKLSFIVCVKFVIYIVFVRLML